MIIALLNHCNNLTFVFFFFHFDPPKTQLNSDNLILEQTFYIVNNKMLSYNLLYKYIITVFTVMINNSQVSTVYFIKGEEEAKVIKKYNQLTRGHKKVVLNLLNSLIECQEKYNSDK